MEEQGNVSEIKSSSKDKNNLKGNENLRDAKNHLKDEDTSSNKQEVLKEKVKNLIKEKNFILLLIIIILGFTLRLYYMILTKNQAEWWDAAEYLSMASNWVFNVPFEFNPQRPILLPLFEAIILKLGGTEFVLKIILELIPSTLIIFFSYLIVKEMYNEKLALITGFFMAVFWLAIFNTVRLHADILLMLFMYLCVYFFWKGYVKDGKYYYIWLMGVFLALAFMTKLFGAILGFIILVFLLITDKLKFLKNKHIWFALIILILMILPYLIWQNMMYGKFNAFFLGSHVLSEPSSVTARPVGWSILSYIPWMLTTPVFILFLVGVLTLYTLILSMDLIIKNKSKDTYNDLFLVLWILIPLIYMVFFERSAEDRWLLPIALPLFILASKGIYFVYDLIKKYHKAIGVVVLFALILAGGYFQISRADEIINLKKNSYSEVRQASLWLKDNSNLGDVIFSKSYPQMTYYTKRKIVGFGANETQFKEDVLKYKPKYLVLSIFEQHGDALKYPDIFKDSLQPVQAYFQDQERTQPILVIYQFINYDL